MSVKCRRIIDELNKLAPESLAEEWDNVGLMIGDLDQEINKVLVALDAIPEVIEEAIKEKVDLIITHHPFIFKPLKSITKDKPIGKSIYSLIQHNIGVYSAHTNLDIAFGGTNDTLANLLELENISILQKIDDYGMGRIGDLKKSYTLEEYAKFIKNKLELPSIRIIGNPKNFINKVAITTGSGISYIQDAVNKQADLFITGDVKFHDAQKAKELGIALIDAGHYGTENIITPVIKKYLENINKEDEKLEIIVSKINGDPFLIY